MKTQQLKLKFKKLLIIVNKQCIEAGTFPGDFETVKTKETKEFKKIQQQLIDLGHEDFVLESLHL